MEAHNRLVLLISLESVVEDLMAQARRTAEASIREAEKFRDEAIAGAHAQEEELRKEYQVKLAGERGSMRKEAVREAEIEARREMQAMKRRLLDTLYSALKERATADEVAGKYIPLFLEKAASELGSGVAHLSGERVPAGRKMGLDLKADLKGMTGIKAESADGSVVLDMTVETLLADFWKGHLARAHNLLFG